MPNTLEPSAWAERHFPGYWEQVAQALAAAGLAAHERALDAKNGSHLETNEAYGATFWLALPQEVSARLVTIPGASLIPPGAGCRYPLIAFGDSLLFPARFGNGSQGVDHLVLHPSGLRTEILAIRDWSDAAVQVPLDLGPEFERDNEPSRIQELLLGVARTILVAYECEARSGLLHVYLGEASFDAETGQVTWLYREELPLATLRGLQSLAVLADEDVTFDNAPEPTVDLQLRDDDAAANGKE